MNSAKIKISMRPKRSLSASVMMYHKIQLITNSHYPRVCDLPLVIAEEERARRILDEFVGDVQGRAFFDYGENATVLAEAIARGARIEKPCDVALLFDVLDHVDDPQTLLKQVRADLNEDGSVMLRCHPWCSRNAMHTATSFNKAYLHLLFNEHEMDMLSLYGKKACRETLDGLPVYRKWFVAAGFKVVFEEAIHQDHEGLNEEFSQRTFGLPDLSTVQFVDYILGAA